MSSTYRRPARRSTYRRPAPRRYSSRRPTMVPRSGKLGLIGVLAVIGALVAIWLAFGGSHGLDGAPGKVVDKERSYTKTNKTSGTWDYDLEIKRASDGKTYWIDVSGDVYDNCVRGAKYPACGD